MGRKEDKEQLEEEDVFDVKTKIPDKDDLTKQLTVLAPKRGPKIPAERWQDIFRCIEKNWSIRKICEVLAPKHNVSERTIEQNVRKAYRVIGETSKIDFAYSRGRHLTTLNAVYDKLIKLADDAAERNVADSVRAYATALRALDQQAKILGIYEAQKVEVKQENMVRATPFDKQKRIAELLERRKEALGHVPEGTDLEPEEVDMIDDDLIDT